MLKSIKSGYYRFGAIATTGVLLGAEAHAGGGGANNFSEIAKNITLSIADLPGLLSALAYMFGLLLGVLGVMKIKDHVENPSQTPLKDGAIRLAAGGALFALPILFEAMTTTINQGAVGAGSEVAKLNKLELIVGP